MFILSGDLSYSEGDRLEKSHARTSAPPASSSVLSLSSSLPMSMTGPTSRLLPPVKIPPPATLPSPQSAPLLPLPDGSQSTRSKAPLLPDPPKLRQSFKDLGTASDSRSIPANSYNKDSKAKSLNEGTSEMNSVDMLFQKFGSQQASSIGHLISTDQASEKLEIGVKNLTLSGDNKPLDVLNLFDMANECGGSVSINGKDCPRHDEEELYMTTVEARHLEDLSNPDSDNGEQPINSASGVPLKATTSSETHPPPGFPARPTVKLEKNRASNSSSSGFAEMSDSTLKDPFTSVVSSCYISPDDLFCNKAFNTIQYPENENKFEENRSSTPTDPAFPSTAVGPPPGFLPQVPPPVALESIPSVSIYLDC